MIRKSFITAAILLLIHSIYVRKSFFVGYPPQQQWQENTIKAQNYLYDNSHKSDYIIVGSSLSNKLISDSLPEFCNLSFAGKSIFDGFEIVSKKKKSPSFLFIEMNFVLRRASKNFTAPIISVVPYFLKEHMPSLRDQYEPTSLLGSKLILPLVDWSITILKPKSPSPADNITDGKNQDIFKKMLNIQVQAYNENPADSTINNAMKNMKDWVLYFQKRKVTVVFYEMPVDNQLKDLIGARRVRDAFITYFPPTQFLYLRNLDGKDLKTMDGLHLDINSARVVSGFFRREAMDIIEGAENKKN